MEDKELEFLIKKSLEKETQNLDTSPFLLQRIKAEASNKTRKGNFNMKIFSLKKLVIIGILCVSSVTCYAAMKLGGITSHSTAREFTSLNNMEKIESQIGFSPKYVESFDNGFIFKDGGVGETQGQDSEGNPMGEKYKSIHFSYYNNDGKNISLIAENGDPWVDAGGEYEGGYSSQMYKFVPPNYELTEEDKKAEKDGSLVISYGSSEVEINNMENYSWQEDGIYYSLVASDCNLGEKAMEDMAAQIKGE